MLQELCKNLWGNNDEKGDVDSGRKALSEGTNHVKSQLPGKTGNAESLTGSEETKIPSRWGAGEVSLKDKQEWRRRDKDSVSKGGGLHRSRENAGSEWSSDRQKHLLSWRRTVSHINDVVQLTHKDGDVGG